MKRRIDLPVISLPKNFQSCSSDIKTDTDWWGNAQSFILERDVNLLESFVVFSGDVKFQKVELSKKLRKEFKEVF